MAVAVKEMLGFQLVSAAKAHRLRMSAELERLGLHVGQELLLLELCERAGPAQTELASRLGVELPTVNRALQRLERAGLIERRRDPADARTSRVHLTDRGGRLCEAIRSAWGKVDAELRAGLSPADAEALRGLLSRLVGNLDTASNEEARG
jgi:MarR family transcriptional regulator, organic hydroperoxide resistance regulator